MWNKILLKADEEIVNILHHFTQDWVRYQIFHFFHDQSISHL